MDDKKLKGSCRDEVIKVPNLRLCTEKASWLSGSKDPPGGGHWRTATCKLSEQGERCLLNIYVDVRSRRFTSKISFSDSLYHSAIHYVVYCLYSSPQSD